MIIDYDTKIAMVEYLDEYIRRIKDDSTEQERDRILMSYTGVKW